ncbi:AAA family ATPase [Candidatus Desantisbacteria bacterium]|nr:AAA family ATPase [Candidatus Desantisbacteria bacterium]
MYKINHIKIEGFRRLKDINLPVRPFMVFIGANGVGKTSLLDAFSLLAASAAGGLNSKLSEFGGVTSVLTRGKAESVELFVDMEGTGHRPIEYDLRLSPKGIGYTISREVLSQSSKGFPNAFKHIDSHDSDIKYFEIEKKQLVHPNWEHNPLETSLSQVPKMFQQPEELRRILGSVTQYHALDVGPRAPVKLPHQMKPADLPGANGEDLIPFLYYLRESNHDRYEAIEDTLRAAFPSFESLSFPPVAAGMLTMTWKDRNFKKPFFMHELSEGTLRFIWLVSLLQSPGLSTVTMIDEPEVSLHPELLSLLADLMREVAKRTHLIVATHSDRFIRFLEPGEIVIMDSDDAGDTITTWGDSLDLDEWLKEYSLDEV